MDEHDNHGQSLAAWTAVIIMIAASALMSLAVAFPNVPLFIGGAVLIVVGAVAGKVLAAAGYGQAGKGDATH